MDDNRERGSTTGVRRLALRCSEQEQYLFLSAVKHLGTNLSLWMRSVVLAVVQEAQDDERRVALQARLALHHGTAQSFGRASRLLNARAPATIIEAFMQAVGDRNLSMALRWSLYEAAQRALAGPSKAAQVEAYQRVQREVMQVVQPEGPHVEVLED